MIAAPENIKGKHAAQKAVDTHRYRLIESVDLVQLLYLHEQIQRAEREFDDDYRRQSFIAKNIDKTTWKSFIRFGDRNRATPGMILYWIKKDGVALDEQALFMSEEYHQEILPDELAQFISEFDRGCHLYEPISIILGLKELWKELTGFHYDFRWIKNHLINVFQEDDLPF